MASYLGYQDGIDFAQFGDTIYLWAQRGWHKFCAALDWFSTYPGRGIRKVFYRGYWVSLKS